MRKNLVLVRHGKAMPLSEGQQDIDRPLSEAGIRSLKASFPRQLSMLGKEMPSVEIWSSPALRALQTAELLTSALGKHKIYIGDAIQEHTSLWNQDEDAFLSELSECEADTVFAVGHNPYCRRLAPLCYGRPCLSIGFFRR